MEKRDNSESKVYTAQDRAVQELRMRISRGIYPRGAVLPSERQIAEEIGISRPVIRAALALLSDEGLITRSPRHRPSVATTLPDLTRTSASAAGVTSSLQAIAAVLPMEPTYRAAYDIQHGIQRALQRQNSSYRLVVFDLLAGLHSRGISSQSADNERQILESIAQEGIAGVIFWQIGGEETLPAVTALRERGIPVVFVDRYPDFPGASPCDFVGVDNRSGAREAVNYLISLGHERIAHLTFPPHSREGSAFSVRERYEGYQEALWENGIPVEPDLVASGSDLIEQIQTEGGPTAVFAVNDASAHRFIERLAAHGVRVPDDVSIIGFDDLDRYSHRSPYLTSVYVPFEAVGEYATEILLQRLQSNAHLIERSEPEPVQHTLLATRLVVRETCSGHKKGSTPVVTPSFGLAAARNGVA